MREFALPFAFLAALAQPLSAQEIGGTPPGGREVTLSATSRESCVEVEIGSERAYNCINEQLKRKADEVNPVLNVAPTTAQSADTRVGIVNVPAVQQQYGKNFGVSVIPFRAPPPVYAAPIPRR